MKAIKDKQQSIVTPVRFVQDQLNLIEEAMKETGENKSEFIRKASVERANKVLVKLG